jgi:Zn ribbon nucleic-acid-binding protein
VLEDIEGVSTRRCVRCGFNDNLELENNLESTDGQQSDNDSQAEEWQPIRFDE